MSGTDGKTLGQVAFEASIRVKEQKWEWLGTCARALWERTASAVERAVLSRLAGTAVPPCFGSDPNPQGQAENCCHDCPFQDACLGGQKP